MARASATTNPLVHGAASTTRAGRALRRATAKRLVVAVSLGAVLVGYALQAFTPLRIESDSTEYLVMAGWIADGRGLPDNASFPPGLPLLLAGLDHVGLGHSSPIVLMNGVFLAAGLAAVASLARRDLGYSTPGAAAVCLVTLLSFPVIRTASHPLSDVPFFGVALSAVALASASRRRGSKALFAGAVALTAAACTFRTIGFALVPMLFAALPTRRARTSLAAVAAPLAVLAYIVGTPGRYASEAEDEWGSAPLSTLGTHLWSLARAFGELAVNAPRERVPEQIDMTYPVLGMIALVPIVVGAWRSRDQAPVAVTFAASLVGVLVAWPFVDSRLVMPVVPLLVVFAARGLAVVARRWARVATPVWAAVFAAAGLVVLAVSLEITFSGDRFPERYNKDLRPTYREAWGKPPNGHVDPRSLWALRRYEPLAIGDPGPTPRPVPGHR